MGLEPRVFESIKRYRRQVWRQRTLLLLPFVLANILGIALIAFFLAYGEAPPSAVGVLGSSVLAVVPYVVIIAALLSANAGYARRRFNAFISREAPDRWGQEESKFREALNGVSIGAGVEPPRLVVYEDPSVNALAFIDRRGKRAIGLTEGMLEADLSTDEINAVLAHELAHLVMGDQVAPPHPFQLEYIPRNLLVMYLFLGLAAAYFAEYYGYQYVPIALVMGMVFVFLLILLFSEAYTVKLLNFAYNHNDILADSVAVEITHDPDALISAIKKVSSLASRVEIDSPAAQLAFDDEISPEVKSRLVPYIFDSRRKELTKGPGVMFLSRYLFVSPQEAVDEYSRFATVEFENDQGRCDGATGVGLFGRGRGRAALRFFKMEAGETTERLVNLDMIRQGYHRSPRDWDAGD